MPAFLCARPMSNFEACQISRSQTQGSYSCQIFMAAGSCELRGTHFLYAGTCELQRLRPQKLENFRKFIYNKRGNININIFNIKLNPCQIFGRK
jgi:hypothetical protein